MGFPLGEWEDRQARPKLARMRQLCHVAAVSHAAGKESMGVFPKPMTPQIKIRWGFYSGNHPYTLISEHALLQG